MVRDSQPDANNGVLVAHPGTQHSHRLAAELQRQGRLAGFHTGIALSESGLAGRSWGLLPKVIRRKAANRVVHDVPPDRLHLHPWCEMAALIGMRMHNNLKVVMQRRNQRFQHAIPQHAIKNAGAVIGFDTSSWILASRCHEAGVPFILDQSTSHPRSKIASQNQVMREFPEWGAGMDQQSDEGEKFEAMEHEQADLVVAASSFTVRTLVEQGVPAGKICVNPYGVDAGAFKRKEATVHHPLRFVYVGAITASKGIPVLLEAWKRLQLKKAELWLVGPIPAQVRALLPSLPGLKIFGALPHQEIPGILQQCDVFLFPSFFEGFGLVILEAMACGLPVVATTSTAGPDLYPAGEGGWIVEPGDLNALMVVMEECLVDPQRVAAMGREARRLAEQHTWAAYGSRWVQFLDSMCSKEWQR